MYSNSAPSVSAFHTIARSSMKSSTPMKLSSLPRGNWRGTGWAESRCRMVRITWSKSAPTRSILFTNAMRGTRYLSAWRHTVSLCGCTPATESKIATAPSTVHLDSRKMNEHILARLPLDESVSLGRIEPLIGKYLSARRCVAQIGEPGEKSQLSAEFAAQGVKTATPASLAKAAAQLSKCAPDALGGLTARSEQISELKSLDLQTVLGVPLTDKDTEKTAGILFVGDDALRVWKPNESYFLQAIGDQIMISVNHTRLRSLVRTLAVADEKTGLLGRGAYIDCLLAESKRSRAQGNPLALVILELDRGADLLREEGDGALESYMNQIARAVEPSIRQGDLGVKYTAWSLAFVLPDTTRENAEAFAEKLRQLAAQVQPDWAKKPLTLAAIVADASAQASDDNEDRVTEWMNRAEFGLEEIRRHGGNRVLLRAAPQPVS